MLGQEGGPVGAEDPGGKELAHSLDEQVFTDRDGGGVVRGLGLVAGVVAVVGAQVVHVVHVGAACVVPGGLAGGAVHGAAAGAAPDPTPEQVGSLGARVPGLPVGGGAVLRADPLGGVPGGPGDDRRVGRLGAPQPLIGWDGLAALAGLGAAAAEHHVPGVLGVAQDRRHPGGGPPSSRIGRRAGVVVGVEPVGDLWNAQLVRGAPGVNLRDDRGTLGFEGQPGLGAALSGLDRYRVGDTFGLVAVGGGADVPPIEGVFAEPFPGFLLDLEPVPLRDALLDPPDQDGRGVHAFDVDGLVGGEQRNACVGQLAFQLEGVERVPAGPLDVLADHGGKPRVRARGFGEQVRQAAVAGDPHVEPLVRAAVAALLDIQAAGFDVPEPGGDERSGRGFLLHRPQLAAQRRHRVLDD